MAAPTISLLGPLTVNGDGAVLSPRDRVVLAALALRAGDAVPAQRLAEALWPEQPPASWLKVVQGCVLRLRRNLGADAIETTPYGYRPAVPLEDIDAGRFERLLQRGRELVAVGEPERAQYVLSDAIGLWGGRPFLDLEGWEPGRAESGRLGELRLEAQECLLDAALRAGRHAEVLAQARARLEEAPLRERRWALLALAQYQSGQQGEALRTLHRARRKLLTDLGLDPSLDLAALETRILRQAGETRSVALLDGTYAVADLEDGDLVGTGSAGMFPVAAAMSPDGARPAIGGRGGEVGLLDLDSGEWVVAPVVAHRRYVLTVSFAADGATIVTSSFDGGLRAWDGHTGAVLGTATAGESDHPAFAAVLPDGHDAIAASPDGAVERWDTRLDRWIDFACALAGRNLTEAEWRDAFGDQPYRQTCPT